MLFFWASGDVECQHIVRLYSRFSYNQQYGFDGLSTISRAIATVARSLTAYGAVQADSALPPTVSAASASALFAVLQ